MSLRDQIIEYARQRPFEWVNGGIYERLAMLEWAGDDGNHFKASNASRRLRELAEEVPGQERILEDKLLNGTVEYKYIPIMQRIQESIPHSQEPQTQEQLTLRI